MCGITGIFRRRGDAPSEKVLDAMTDRLEHRGPDGRGTYLWEAFGIGHRRLSIIGVGDGAQPMRNEDGSVWVTYNGEIYNHQALRTELIELGHTFETHADTEVIVHGYEAWGPAVAERLRGIFAFTVLDQRANKMLCVRDRLGVKPFYYHLAPDLFLFASEPKALLVHPDMPKRPDLDALNLFLRYGYAPAPYASFAGMRQLEPGCRMIVTADASRIERYWTPPEFGRGTAREIQDTLEKVIDESVGIELMSEVPLGAFLSGGVDSSIVAASMAHSPGLDAAPRTFCIGFEVDAFDESPHSRAVADHLKLDHQIDMVSMDDLSGLDTLVETYDEPFGDASAIPTYALCRMAKKHVTVALSGDGGDEVFAGYRRYGKLGGFSELPAIARQVASQAADLYPPIRRGQTKLRKFGSTIGEQYDIELAYFPGYVVPELVTPELDRHTPWSLSQFFDRAPGEHDVARAQWVDIMTYLPNDILTKVDRASMAHALEVRVPLLDHKLIEWAAQLSVADTYQDGALKVALKDHLARRVPRKIIDRPKMGFGVPLENWLGAENGLNDIADRLKARHPKNRFHAPIRADAIERLTSGDHIDGDFSQKIWGLLFLETWWQKHFV